MTLTKPVFASLFIGMLLMLGPLCGPICAGDMTLGEQLEREMWKDIKARNWNSVSEKIAPAFQSAHVDGARDRDGEIALIKGLALGNYTLSNFKVTEQGGVIVVTYFVSVEETIDNTRLSSAPATRLSVWTQTDGRWQWIAHVNLRALK